jgi:hypothetical protein
MSPECCARDYTVAGESPNDKGDTMMKRVLAVAFLLMSLASIALADGSGPPPDQMMKKPPVAIAV